MPGKVGSRNNNKHPIRCSYPFGTIRWFFGIFSKFTENLNQWIYV